MRNDGKPSAKRRPGAGRKPKAATILKRRLIENKVDEAEASFAFLVAVRDNSAEPTSLRMAAAALILDRVLGKAKEHLENVGEMVIRIERERNSAAPAGAASGATGNQG